MGIPILFRRNVADTGPGVLHQYTVGNRGTEDLLVGTISLVEGTGDIAAFAIESDFASGTTIPPGESRGWKVRFDPAEPGEYLASIHVPMNDPDGAADIQLLGEVVEEVDTVPGIVVDPLTWDFGNIDTASGSASHAFTVSSTGTESLVMGTVAVAGTGYSKSADGVSGVTIPVGESRTVTATLNPTSDGTKAGTLTFPSNAGASVVVPLTGVGTTGGPDPEPYLATRLYLTRQASPVADITDTSWASHTPDADCLLSPVKGGPPVSLGTPQNHNGVSGGRNRLGRWVSPPLAAFGNLDDTIRCYITCHRSSALGPSVTSVARFGRWRAGTMVWSALLSMGSPVEYWDDSTDPEPRRFPAGPDYTWRAQVNDIQDDDRLVLEVGFRAFSTSTNAARIRWGGASTDDDLAAANTSQDLGLASWIEFSGGLLLLP